VQTQSGVIAYTKELKGDAIIGVKIDSNGYSVHSCMRFLWMFEHVVLPLFTVSL